MLRTFVRVFHASVNEDGNEFGNACIIYLGSYSSRLLHMFYTCLQLITQVTHFTPYTVKLRFSTYGARDYHKRCYPHLSATYETP